MITSITDLFWIFGGAGIMLVLFWERIFGEREKFTNKLKWRNVECPNCGTYTVFEDIECINGWESMSNGGECIQCNKHVSPGWVRR